ncbi:hypothetical protein BDW75DRAFT_244294 [Aspergillus navahoensis]
MVMFLLDSDPPWGPSMRGMRLDGHQSCLRRARRVLLARVQVPIAPGAKALRNQLLDRGASACDAAPFQTDIDTASDRQLPPQAEFTVLSQAITGCSYDTVEQLPDHGADIQERLEYYSDGPGFCDGGVAVRDVTTLHLGSWWNADGGQSTLYRLAYSSLDGEPIDLNLINFSQPIEYDLTTQTEIGEITLHTMARNLRQAAAARALIAHGARIEIVSNKGNTPPMRLREER